MKHLGVGVLTHDDVGAAALALSEAHQSSHFGKVDFRVRNKIFASLPDEVRCVVKLTMEQQDMMASAEPEVFQALSGGWGKKGWTSVNLAACDMPTLVSALRTAWRNVAPARVLDLES